MERLIISDEVRELMPTAVLARVIAHREHTEVVCSVCGGHVQPDDPAPMSVVVRFDAISGRPVTQYAHAGCSPSAVDPRPVPVRGNDRLTYLTLLRQHPLIPVLVWEPNRLMIDVERGSVVTVSGYRRLGFQPSEAGLEGVVGPVLRGWVLRGRKRDLVLDSPHGVLEEFHDVAGSRHHPREIQRLVFVATDADRWGRQPVVLVTVGVV